MQRREVDRQIAEAMEGFFDWQDLEVEPGREPAVFMFQPLSFKVIPEPRLQVFEDLLAKRVGLERVGMRSIHRCETISGSGGVNGDWDDCDQVPGCEP